MGISSSTSTNEKCFEETHELIFHIGGLVADTAYSLRIVLFERDKAIAVSIRSFIVAGIRGFFGEQVLTIQTAVQVALSYQTAGDTAQAEKIYRSVLSVVPLYPDALHLLGLVLHQQGSTKTAISYIEKALQGTKSFEGYHNSLGECYRVLGRIADAEDQFEKALTLNPNYIISAFNLGLVYQQSGRLDKALVVYKEIGETVDVTGDFNELQIKSKVRECDLAVSVVGRTEGLACWRAGIAKYPNHDVFYNELGSLLLDYSNYETALMYYTKGASMGNALAAMNQAHVLETLGQFNRSVDAYELIVLATEAKGLPSFHMKLKKVALLPRILPPAHELAALRERMEVTMKELLLEKGIVVDNAPPSEYGFSAGYFLITHGANNLRLKLMLGRLYLRFCPALATGHFL